MVRRELKALYFAAVLFASKSLIPGSPSGFHHKYLRDCVLVCHENFTQIFRRTFPKFYKRWKCEI